ncbi:MAG: HPr family phosphocarrier protein [Clostridia bacterium]|nr:HPr family phosphocarrier protein [Clostridia bacterium]
MTEEIIKVKVPNGLHGRNLSILIDSAMRFESAIWIGKDGRQVNAKSLMGMLTLHVMYGDEIEIMADGSDSNEAVELIAELIRTNFLDKSVIDKRHNN